MIIQIPKSASSEELFEYFQSSRINRLISYLIDWRYRKSVNLKQWCANQVQNPDSGLEAYAGSLRIDGDYDAQMYHIFAHVCANYRYMSERAIWDIDEYWQTAYETATRWYVIKNRKLELVATDTFSRPAVRGCFRCGDCEDGMILLYVLARLCGIPESRLIQFCGDVIAPGNTTVTGHAWLGYKPLRFPVNYAFMDWCYYPSMQPVSLRNLFGIRGKRIIEHSRQASGMYVSVASQYKSIWFGFNEDVAFRDHTPRWAI